MARPSLDDQTSATGTPTRIWDAPLRLFHWLFVLAFGAAWFAVGDRYLYTHVFAGYAFGALLVFRILWGFLGGGHARFARFLYSPSRALTYLRGLVLGKAPRFVGHNPAGSWAVFAILVLATALAVTGLLTLGGQEQAGPLRGALSFGAGARFRNLHEILAWALLTLAALHVAGVVVGSLVHRENLIGAMITGRKRAAREPNVRTRLSIGLVVVALLLAGAGLYFRPLANARPGKPFLPYTGPRLADNATWRAECGGCHLAYQAGLLPARSWRRMLSHQHDHFGEDLALDARTVDTIQAFLVDHAAEQQKTEAAWYVAHTTRRDQTPLRITDTAYWKDKHAALNERVWSRPPVHGRADCAACHLDADAGTFRDGAMHIPAATLSWHEPGSSFTLLAQETHP